MGGGGLGKPRKGWAWVSGGARKARAAMLPQGWVVDHSERGSRVMRRQSGSEGPTLLTKGSFCRKGLFLLPHEGVCNGTAADGHARAAVARSPVRPHARTPYCPPCSPPMAVGPPGLGCRERVPMERVPMVWQIA